MKKPKIFDYRDVKRLLMMGLLLLTMGLTGCGDAFDYHPYDVRFKGASNINATNIALIEQSLAEEDTVRFAFISDNHLWLTELKDIVGDINRRDSIDFVIHGGDLTDCATTSEFVWSRDILQQLDVPYVVLIGNHDMLGTGLELFEAMYGEVDFSFIAGRVKFICLNTNATEYNYMAPVPNFDFMIDEATRDSAHFNRAILCMHAPPFSNQFNNNVAKIFAHIYHQIFPNLMFCLNGHEHNNSVSDLYNDGTLYYQVGATEERAYSLFTITPSGYSHETIRL